MADEKRFTVALGVRAERFGWGWLVEGQTTALIAAGVIEPDWVASGNERLPNGNIVRTRYTQVGGVMYETTVTAKGACRLSICVPEDPNGPWRDSCGPALAAKAAKARARYDGARKVVWADCAWRPKLERGSA